MADRGSYPQPPGQAVEPGSGAQQGCPVRCPVCGGALTFGYGAETLCVRCEIDRSIHGDFTPSGPEARFTPADPSGGAGGGQRE